MHIGLRHGGDLVEDEISNDSASEAGFSCELTPRHT